MTIEEIAKRLVQENYEFTVEVKDVRYDVYWFEGENGKIGQIAFTMSDGKAIVPYIRVGRHPVEHVEKEIVEAIEGEFE